MLRDIQVWQRFEAVPDVPHPAQIADHYGVGRTVLPINRRRFLFGRSLEMLRDLTVEQGRGVAAIVAAVGQQ
jgi:hypothetical protein